ncbi:MAG: gliding motility-associated C-terminal domain-containing protein, partial [Spirosomataceae bacterium]
MKIYLLFFILLLTFDVTATHIVGGEIDMQAITNVGNATHLITLNLYFDDINGSPGAEDAYVTVGIFRKRDNYMMGIVSLPKVSTQQITYSNPLCATGTRIQTRQIKYSGTAILLPINFDDTAGYYIAWERCCRNTSITNIQNPGSAGSTFYLEFPAFKQGNGTIITNSTPQFD